MNLAPSDAKQENDIKVQEIISKKSLLFIKLVY